MAIILAIIVVTFVLLYIVGSAQMKAEKKKEQTLPQTDEAKPEATQQANEQKAKNENIGKILLIAFVVFCIVCLILVKQATTTKPKGYNKPNSSHSSVSDYIKDEDPDLWNSMQERWDSLGD